MRDWKKWTKAAGVRAVKTMAQTALSLISVGMVITEVNWLTVGSASVVAGIYSLLTSIAGLPEVPLMETEAETEVETEVKTEAEMETEQGKEVE